MAQDLSETLKINSKELFKDLALGRALPRMDTIFGVDLPENLKKLLPQVGALIKSSHSEASENLWYKLPDFDAEEVPEISVWDTLPSEKSLLQPTGFLVELYGRPYSISSFSRDSDTLYVRPAHTFDYTNCGFLFEDKKSSDDYRRMEAISSLAWEKLSLILPTIGDKYEEIVRIELAEAPSRYAELSIKLTELSHLLPMSGTLEVKLEDTASGTGTLIFTLDEHQVGQDLMSSDEFRQRLHPIVLLLEQTWEYLITQTIQELLETKADA